MQSNRRQRRPECLHSTVLRGLLSAGVGVGVGVTVPRSVEFTVLLYRYTYVGRYCT